MTPLGLTRVPPASGLTDWFLWQGEQMIPGQIQKMSQKRTLYFGQCGVTVGRSLGQGWLAG